MVSFFLFLPLSPIYVPFSNDECTPCTRRDGRIHGRCRLTPFPVTLDNFSWPFEGGDEALAAAYYNPTHPVTRCRSDWNNSDIWATPQPCAWPLAPSPVVRLCGLLPSDLAPGALVVGGARLCPDLAGTYRNGADPTTTAMAAEDLRIRR